LAELPLALKTASAAPQGAFAVEPWRAFADAAGWDALAHVAAEPNPFAERWFAQAGLTAFDPRGAVALASLRHEGRLVGLLPLARRLVYDRYPLPHICNWLHPNAFCGAPLVAHGAEHDFWRALLGWADHYARAALFLHLERLPADGPLYAALRDVVAAAHRPAAAVHREERALLASDLDADAYFEASLSTKKRKELRRQFNRLADEGAVAVERCTDDAGLAEWIDAFLSLERAGWKGAEGSALACADATERFFRQAMADAAAAGRLERLALTLDRHPIAMLANFLTPPGAFSFKTTYDERLARFSPGVLLQRENLALLARDDIAWCDSCAAADHPMIERIWREKRAIVRVSIAIGGPARQALGHRLLRAETGAEPKGL
jgi:CelD/BcsL family acetyltransferase involved in cellulose biosynthesis